MEYTSSCENSIVKPHAGHGDNFCEHGGGKSGPHNFCKNISRFSAKFDSTGRMGLIRTRLATEGAENCVGCGGAGVRVNLVCSAHDSYDLSVGNSWIRRYWSSAGKLAYAYLASYWFAAFSDFTAIPFALSYVVILGSKIVDMYKHLASSFTRNLQNQGETWEAKKRFKLLQLYKRRFCRIANYYCFCTVAQSATALLEILGLATQNISSITTNDTLVLYVTLNFVTLAFLAYAGNTFETEVK